MKGKKILKGLLALALVAGVIGRGKRRGGREEGGSPKFGRRHCAHEAQSA